MATFCTHKVYDDLQRYKEKLAHSRACNLISWWYVTTRYSSPTNELCIILDTVDECRDNGKILPHTIRLATPHVIVAFTMKSCKRFSAILSPTLRWDQKTSVMISRPTWILGSLQVTSSPMDEFALELLHWSMLAAEVYFCGLDWYMMSLSPVKLECVLSSLLKGLPEVYKSL